ncbi:MAG: PDZ domain-containing protein [Phycisphaerales bacterium]|nr:MAG: PDZ domain-containing protein [Phycisphaerales bacterium]
MHGAVYTLVAAPPTPARAPAPGIRGASGSDGRSVASNVTIIEDASDKRRVRIELRGGAVRAFVNGQEVPAERVVREGDALNILDEQGDAIYTTKIVDHVIMDARDFDTNVRIYRGAMGEDRSIFDPVTLGPRPMIGVSMSAPDEALAAQLGLAPDAGVLIRDVTPGMPAEKAGLRRFDIVTHVNGVEPVNEETLRRAVRESAAGDTITLRVLRQGRSVDVPVVVEESDPTMRLQVDVNRELAGNAQRWRAFAEAQGAEARERAEEIRRMLSVRQEQLGDVRERLMAEWDKLRERLDGDELAELEDTIRRITESLSSLQLDINLPSIRFVPDGDQERSMVMLRPAQPAVPPAPHGVGGQAGEQRMRSLEERMARIEALLERLVESDR